MNTLEIIQKLCGEKNTNPSRLETELGLGKGTIHKWAKSYPNTEKLLLVANYFNVSVDYLLGRTGDENSDTMWIDPSDSDTEAPTDFYIGRIARAGKKLTKEQSEHLLKYAEFMFPEAFDEEQKKRTI